MYIPLRMRRGGRSSCLRLRNPGADFDRPPARPALEPLAYLRMKHDSSRQQSGNLLEDHCLAVALHADNILLVLLRGSLIHGVQELSALVADLADYSRDRGA